jgi:hypothetical protein
MKTWIGRRARRGPEQQAETFNTNGTGCRDLHYHRTFRARCGAASFPRGTPMKFEHLIAINDPLNPLIDPLTRLQLWRGLVLRAESPQLFLPQLDDCQLSERSADAVWRVLRYGELTIRDHVTYIPQLQVRYQVPPQKGIAASSLCMSIEEPQPELLFVRFTYDDGASAAEDAANAMYDDFRRSAYQEADIDTIRLIREMAAEGRFDAPLN